MTNRVAFLSRLPPLAIFAKVFGIEYLSKSGFEVVFVDVSFLLFFFAVVTCLFAKLIVNVFVLFCQLFLPNFHSTRL